MRDSDEFPRIVIEREGGGPVGSFLLGALVGAGLALLLAPRSGEEVQAEIRERARRLREGAEARVREAQERIEERMHAARESTRSRVEDVKGAVDAGRRAAVEARHELEDRLDRSKAAYRAGIDAARQAVAEGGVEDEGEGEGEDRGAEA